MAQVEFQNNAHLEQLLTSNPKMEAKVRNIVRQVLKSATGKVRHSYSIQSTREAYRAIRSSVYKKVLGGNINILNSRKQAVMGSIPPKPNRGKMVGGNRIPRSKRTEQLLSYRGASLAFVLRFLSNGTKQRNNGYGNRGAIAARNWFGPLAQRELEQAAEQFDQLLTQLIEKEFKNE